MRFTRFLLLKVPLYLSILVLMSSPCVLGSQKNSAIEIEGEVLLKPEGSQEFPWFVLYQEHQKEHDVLRKEIVSLSSLMKSQQEFYLTKISIELPESSVLENVYLRIQDKIILREAVGRISNSLTLFKKPIRHGVYPVTIEVTVVDKRLGRKQVFLEDIIEVKNQENNFSYKVEYSDSNKAFLKKKI